MLRQNRKLENQKFLMLVLQNVLCNKISDNLIEKHELKLRAQEIFVLALSRIGRERPKIISSAKGEKNYEMFLLALFDLLKDDILVDFKECFFLSN